MSRGDEWLHDPRPIQRIKVFRDAPIDEGSWPADIPAVAQFLDVARGDGWELGPGVTFLVGEKDEKKKAVGDGSRMIYTQHRPAWSAKNRYGLPFEMPLSWSDFEEAARKGEPESADELVKTIETLIAGASEELAKKGRDGLARCGTDVRKLASLADWSDASVFSGAEYASPLLRPLLTSPFDFLATALTAGSLAALLLYAVEAWRVHSWHRRVRVIGPSRTAFFVTLQLAAGAAVAILLSLYQAFLRDTVANTTLDLLHFSLHPWGTPRLALQVGLIAWHATALEVWDRYFGAVRSVDEIAAILGEPVAATSGSAG